MPMQVTANGSPLSLPDGATVAGLLSQLGLEGRPVVVEVNQRALFPRELQDTRLREGDVIELVQITAGG